MSFISEKSTPKKPEITLIISPKYGKNGHIKRLKEFAKKVLGRRRGPDQVIHSLLRGLDELNIQYNINPKVSDFADIVHVPVFPEVLEQAIALKQRGVFKTLIAGPSIVIVPTESNGILLSPEIDTVVLPSQWVADLYISISPELKDKIKVWPSGVKSVEADKQVHARGTKSSQLSMPSTSSAQSTLRCLIYSKNAPSDLESHIHASLKTRGIECQTFVYGNFKQPAYFEALCAFDFALFISPTESQGLALQEAWMRDVPTLVWNTQEWKYKDMVWHDEKISAPYQTNSTGMFFVGKNDFDQKLDIFLDSLIKKNFAPRSYVMNNLTDRHSAQKLMDIARQSHISKKIPTHLPFSMASFGNTDPAFAKTKETKTLEHKKYFDYLDALRCMAFLLVFYAHTGSIFKGADVSQDFPLNIWQKFTVYGSYGVNFFFVLSGFLITYLLLKEKAHSSPAKNNPDLGTVSIRSFYRKRVLRIWPVYFTTLLFGAFILPFLISSSTYSIFTLADPTMSARTFFYNFFFSGNFYQGMSIAMAPLSIGILWSVCIEEQFYLVWPWIVKWLNIRTLAFVTALLVTLSLLYKFIWAEDRMANYYLPWSLAMDLGFGALLGIAYFAKRIRRIITSSGFIISASLALTIAIALINRGQLVEILRLTKTPIIDCIFVLIILFFINRTKALADSAQSAPKPQSDHISSGAYATAIMRKTRDRIYAFLTHLGKISYGLYAYHTTCLMLVVAVLHTTGILNRDVSRSLFFLTIVLAFILTIMVAELSYFIMEKRFLALKSPGNKTPAKQGVSDR